MFAAAGARLVPVPVDGEGLDVAAGERAAPKARLAYVTPSHQFPLGAVMSVSRRLALLAWARRAEAWVLEDDYDSEFRYAGRPLPCLQGLDVERQDAAGPARVLYIGTFSKTLAPALRLGYLIVPDALVDAFRAARAVLDRHAPTLAQGVLADFIAEGHYARHVRRVRAVYAERQAALLAAAEAELAGLLTLTPDPAGLHLVGRLAPGLDAEEAAAAGRGGGRAGVPGLALCTGGGCPGPQRADPRLRGVRRACDPCGRAEVAARAGGGSRVGGLRRVGASAGCRDDDVRPRAAVGRSSAARRSALRDVARRVVQPGDAHELVPLATDPALEL